MKLIYIVRVILPLIGAFLIAGGVSMAIDVLRQPDVQMLGSIMAGLTIAMGLVVGTVLWWGNIEDWISRNW